MALIPKKNDLINQVATMLRDTYGYQTEGWDSVEDLFAYTSSIDYKWDVCFGIEIPEPIGDTYSYKLIFNNTGPPSRELDDVPDTTRSNVY